MPIPLYANVRPRIARSVATILPRELAGPGQIKVSPNQEVSPTDIIADYQVPTGFLSVNVAKQLGVSPDQVEAILAKPIGSMIYRGELIAKKRGLMKEMVVVSPTDGLVERIDPSTGAVIIKFLAKEIHLPAGVYGVVAKVDHALGRVYIKTLAHQIHGVLGSGKGRIGNLEVASEHTALTRGVKLSPGESKQVLVAGALIDRGMIQRAFQLGVSGIVAGGIDYDAYKALLNDTDKNNNIITDNGISIIATEGFGALTMDKSITKLLADAEHSLAYIDGNAQRLLLPCATSQSIIDLRRIELPNIDHIHQPPQIIAQELTIGQRIRLIWPPFMGATGQVVVIDQQPTLLESGLKTFLVTVEIQSHKIKVPYTNLEIIAEA